MIGHVVTFTFFPHCNLYTHRRPSLARACLVFFPVFPFFLTYIFSTLFVHGPHHQSLPFLKINTIHSFNPISIHPHFNRPDTHGTPHPSTRPPLSFVLYLYHNRIPHLLHPALTFTIDAPRSTARILPLGLLPPAPLALPTHGHRLPPTPLALPPHSRRARLPELAARAREPFQGESDRFVDEGERGCGERRGKEGGGEERV